MASASSGTVAATTAVSEEEEAVSQESLNATAAAAAAAVESILNRADSTNENNSNNDATTAEPSRKKLKTDDKEKLKEKPSSASPKEVRVLHILKKHKGSRRPASWRNPNITDTKSKAIADLQELLSILSESKSNPKELRATFEELAKTESDCSSAKRGGDLGFFGRKKMQPAFEKASFGLNIGELSDVVDTSSGVHIILRLA
jgi:NIMA-interacting peptidyl-prolyl cis-trans isomerase 1